MSDAQPTSPSNRAIYQATVEQRLEISSFLKQNNLTHRHLEWFDPLDWLGEQPYLIERLNGHIHAIMLTAHEVEDSTWVRLFSANKDLVLEEVWERLLSKSVVMLKEMGITHLAALGFSDWFTNLLLNANFIQQNSIAVLEWKGHPPTKAIIEPEIKIRQMCYEDLPVIAQIDRLAFSSLWKNTLNGLTKAFKQLGHCSVAIHCNEIVGYQISTAVTIQAHLARLAVHPDHQRKKIASALVLDMLKEFSSQGIWRVTVNTQTDNAPSLALYQKFGFKRTQETIPVFIYNF